VRRVIVLVAMAALGGCATLNDVRSGPPSGTGRSSKSIGELSECVTHKWDRHQIELASVPIKNGVTISASARAFGAPKVWRAVDIIDAGDHREVALHIVGNHPDAGLKEIAGCL